MILFLVALVAIGFVVLRFVPLQDMLPILGAFFAIGFLAVVVAVAPLVEELVFRGLLYGWLAGRWGKTVGWIVSSLAFAAAHTEPAHIVLVLPLGLLFGWLRQRTDSLLPSLVAHIANNGLALVAAAYLDG